MVLRDTSAETFHRIAQTLKVSKHGERPLTHIVKEVREHFRAKACSVYEVRDEALILVASDEDGVMAEERAVGAPEPPLESALNKKRSVFDREAGMIPIVYQEKVVGALTLQKRLPNGFTDSERRFLEFVALQLAGAMQSLSIAERAIGEIQQDREPSLVRGIAVSSGFGIGPALFLHPGIAPPGISLPDLSSRSTRKEWENLQSALHKTSEDLGRLEKSVGNAFSKNESGIFDSHRTILADADFLEKLEGEIQTGKNALETVEVVLQAYMHQFHEMAHPRMKDTAVDLEDLKQRIFENLLGMGSRREKADWAGILVAKSLGPSDTIRLDPSKLLGIVTMTGGPTSHAAILARSLGIPAVMGAVGIMASLRPGDLLIVDGEKGEVVVNPSVSILRDYEVLEENRLAEIVKLNALADEPAVTLDGRLIHLEANASFLSDLRNLRHFGAEGVGLFRTEFLFLNAKELPRENDQFDVYRQMIEAAAGLPITFRILDAGGDKFLTAMPREKEENPFLGYRSIRLTLSQPTLLKTQFRALLRASAFGKIRLLIPMISGMEEVDAIHDILAKVKRELSDANIPHDPDVPIGFMIEVPSAIPLARHLIRHADFLSIGTNDLTQYTLAVDRNNERVAVFFEPLHPAVISFIAQVAQTGLKARKSVGICGEMASDPAIIPLLVGLGITHLSMIPSCILEAKKVIRRLDYAETKKMAKRALRAARIREVKAILGIDAPPGQDHRAP